MDVIKFSTEAASGSVGNASAHGYSPMMSGLVYKVVIDFANPAPSTCDVTLTDVNDPAAEAIVQLTDVNTQRVLYPRRAMTTNSGTNATYNGSQFVPTPYTVHGYLRLNLEQADPGCVVTATVYVIKG
ncbi:MAG: hypothetical protein ACPL3P_05880 [Anaerolineales bacterium]